MSEPNGLISYSKRNLKKKKLEIWKSITAQLTNTM